MTDYPSNLMKWFKREGGYVDRSGNKKQSDASSIDLEMLLIKNDDEDSTGAPLYIFK